MRNTFYTVRAIAAIVGVTLLAGAFALAQTKMSGQPAASELAFVQSIQKDLNHRFSTIAAAERAGYFRYTNEDNTGAISYANLQWTSADPSHPSQLWYDVHGNLLGADFSVPYSASRPNLWGVNPARWLGFRGPHVHYILKKSDGTLQYGLAVRGKAFSAAGGNFADPQASTLVKMGAVKNAQSVYKVFTFPAIWDLMVWAKQNPDGAFAEANPLVHPSASAQKDSM